MLIRYDKILKVHIVPETRLKLSVPTGEEIRFPYLYLFLL